MPQKRKNRLPPKKAPCKKMTEEEHMAALCKGRKQYWDDIRAGKREMPKVKGRKLHLSKEERKNRSERAKAQWRNMPEEEKKKRFEQLAAMGAGSWSPEKRKKIQAKISKIQATPSYRLRMSKAIKAVYNDPVKRKRILEAHRKAARTPEGIKQFKKLVKTNANDYKVEERWAIESGAIDKAKEEYKKEYESLYNMACNALKGVDVKPLKDQPLDYYREIIGYFEPDWVEFN